MLPVIFRHGPDIIDKLIEAILNTTMDSPSTYSLIILAFLENENFSKKYLVMYNIYTDGSDKLQLCCIFFSIYPQALGSGFSPIQADGWMDDL